MSGDVAVSRWAVHLPRLTRGATVGGWDPGEACPPERAHDLLGRKGLLAKEPATRLALCVVHRALDLPDRCGRRGPAEVDPDTAVVVSSNLGNVDTVARLSRSLRDAGVRSVSPLEAPNSSSNVIGSSVAIWFRFGGPNLTVCSGHPAGADAIGLARRLLLAGRARRVVVVGVEPADATTDALLVAATGRPAVPVAACVVLEPATGDPRSVVHAVIDGPADGPAGLSVDRGATRASIDTDADGCTYGAQGVLQVAVAAAILAADGRARSAVAVSGAPVDGFRSVRISRGTPS